MCQYAISLSQSVNEKQRHSKILLLAMFRFGAKNIPRAFQSNKTTGPNRIFAIMSTKCDLKI